MEQARRTSAQRTRAPPAAGGGPPARTSAQPTASAAATLRPAVPGPFSDRPSSGCILESVFSQKNNFLFFDLIKRLYKTLNDCFTRQGLQGRWNGEWEPQFKQHSKAAG